jgi:hypothetical protein
LRESGGRSYTSPLPEDAMKNPYEVLRQTELRIVRVRKEIEALLIVAPLLKDESDKLSEEQTSQFAIRA